MRPGALVANPSIATSPSTAAGAAHTFQFIEIRLAHAPRARKVEPGYRETGGRERASWNRAAATRAEGPQGGTEGAQRPRAAQAVYIASGALTPSSPSDSAITRRAATDSAILSDSTASGLAPTTLQSR